jgi:hemerythrin superfamily protein
MSTSTKTQTAGTSSVTDMLRQDHQNVKDLFQEFEQTEDAKAKQQIAKTAMTELDVHSKLEEELIYPAIRDAVDDDELMDEALEEHQAVHGLIKELKKMKRHDEQYDSKFRELVDNVNHHIEEEESKMLPEAEDSEIDWDTLSSQVMKRKEQLTSKGRATSKPRSERASRKK